MNDWAPILTHKTKVLEGGIWEEQDYEGCYKATDWVSYNFTSCVTAFSY